MITVYSVISDFISTDYFESRFDYGMDKDILSISKGPMNVKINNEIKVFPPFTAFYYPAWTPFLHCSVDGEPYHDCSIQFIKDSKLSPHPLLPASEPIYLKYPKQILDLVDTIAGENVFYELYQKEIMDNLVKTLLLKILNYSDIQNNVPYFNELHYIRQQIYQYPERDWKMTTIAEKLNISSGYIQHLYKNAFQTTCAQDVIQSRIQMSKQLLASTNMSIEQIAHNAGYHDSEHFFRQFKQYTDYTPSNYRKHKQPALSILKNSGI